MTPSFESSPVLWREDRLWLLDQRQLPAREIWLPHDDVTAVVEAIRQMVVRGAPAIGITAAYGVVLAVRERLARHGTGWREALETDLAALAASRPTAVNLFWALNRMGECLARLDPAADPVASLCAEALRIHAEDVAGNQAMGRLGADLIRQQSHPSRAVLTHCNAGALATGGYGTALGVIRTAWSAGLIDRVYADETRPWWQGARLTAWELQRDGIPVTLHGDSVAATLMRQGRVGWVIVGADRIAANGDVANKIGTYPLAVLARHHGVRFMVVAPLSTFDARLADGSAIPIEERDPAEVVSVNGLRLAPEGVAVFNPVFDVTPAGLIDAIVTERGRVERPDPARIRALLALPAASSEA